MITENMNLKEIRKALGPDAAGRTLGAWLEL